MLWNISQMIYLIYYFDLPIYSELANLESLVCSRIYDDYILTADKLVSRGYVAVCEMAMPVALFCSYLPAHIGIPQGDLVSHTCDALSQPMWLQKGQIVKFPACNWVTAQSLLFHRVNRQCAVISKITAWMCDKSSSESMKIQFTNTGLHH